MLFKLLYRINEKLASPLGFIAVLLLVSVITYFTASNGFPAVAISLLVVVGILSLVLLINNPFVGLLVLFYLSNFYFYILRLLKMTLPLGVVIDVGLLLILFRILIEKKPSSIRSYASNPVFIVLFLWFGYILLQVANPSGFPNAWLYGFREQLRFLFIAFVSYYLLRDSTNLNYFLKGWYILALLTALYGMYQQFIGIPEFELQIALEDEKFRNLQFVGGRWRKWSFLGNSTDFGIYMAISGVFFLIYSFRKSKLTSKILLWVGASLMLISSSYSGTRTATAMIGIGLLYYLFFEINNVRVLLSMFVLFAVFMAIIFGPFHGPTVRRIRSTFQPSEDASYQVREYNRERIRPYILSHPIGGGLFTSGGTIKDLGYHPLASIPPDGYFMRMAMETGWIGLLIQLVLFGTIIIVGIRIYFQTIDYYSENERYALKGFITVIIMLSAAGYAQDNAFQIPYVFVAWGIIGYVASAYKKTFLKVESA